MKYKFGFISIVMLVQSITARAQINVQEESSNFFEISKNIEIFTSLYKELNTYYVDPLDPGKLMKIAIDAMLGSLDPYTNFYSESQIEGSRFLMEGNYDGIGAELKQINGNITLFEIFENGPAFQAGLRVGDVITHVQDEKVSERNLEEFKAIMRGTPGTEVNIQVQRPGEDSPLSLTLLRGETKIDNVPYYGMVDSEVGYISLVVFTKEAGRNVRNALKELQRNHPNMKSVILDLRNNGGGLLHEAVNLCNIFLPNNQLIVSTKGKVSDWDALFKTKGDPTDLDIPVVVLVNKMSASASEIVSGVIQDYDRGVVIGQRTYGKGLVQNTKTIGFNNQFKLTTSKYYIPSGRCIQSVAYENGEPKDIADDERNIFKTLGGRPVLDGGGITPDIMVPSGEDIPFIKTLLEENIIFHYITEYLQKNPIVSDPETFQFTDFSGFKKFAETRKNDFKLPIEQFLYQLKEEAERKEFSADVSKQIAALQKAIDKEKEISLDLYKNEIVKIIGEQIVTRTHWQSGRVKFRLKNDNEMEKAIEILKNPTLYHNILGGQ
jgi:carboxyl-terminal processing protease